MKEITSLQNPEVKKIVQLRSKSRFRKESGEFLVEGRREFERACSTGFELQNKFRNPEILQDTDPWNGFFQKQGPDEVILRDKVYEKVSVREGTEGIIGIFKERSIDFFGLEFRNSPLFLVLDGIEKPGNLGAIFRTADAAGIDGVMISGFSGDLYNPNTIRASLGCVFSVPWAITDPKTILNFLEEKGLETFLALPGEHPSVFDLDFSKGGAICLGSEDKGISSDYLKGNQRAFNIPMNGIADSLNVSVSAGIVVYEALRQRTSP